MENNTRKYILIPDYKPLWAMAKCFGPTHGPLTEPCPTTLDIIGQLLRQDGKDALTIMEVLNPRTNPGSEPVKLTLDNYTLPYEDILRGVKVEKTVTKPVTNAGQPVKPTITEADKAAAASIRNMINGVAVEDQPEPETPAEDPAPVVEEPLPETPGVNPDGDLIDACNADGTASQEDHAPIENDGSDEVEAETDTGDEAVVINGGLSVGDPEPAQAVETVVSDPYAGMTKKQRREARKAAEAAAAAANETAE
ncbi:MAG: hypothetical protein NC311_05805 [Muribaculaceae bacterium]|nr:hypothetical protein [Muribaculaceae bacterium]